MSFDDTKPAGRLPKRGKRRQSVRWNIMALLGSVGLIAVLVIGASTTFFIYRTEQAAWKGRQAEAARSAADKVATFISNSETTLHNIGLLDAAYLQTNPKVVQQILDVNPAFLELTRLDARGNVLANGSQGTPLLANLFTIPQSNWFLEAVAGHKYVGGVQISSENQPYLILAMPASDGGVVAVRLSMNVLWEVVGHIRFGQSGQAYVIDHTGQILAHTRPQVVLSGTTLTGRPELKALLSAPDTEWNGEFINFEGQRVVGSAHPVAGTAWVMITELPQAEAYAASRTALVLLGGGMAALGLMVMWVTRQLLTKQLFVPVEQLRAGAERIGQGDLGHQIEVIRFDEIGQVAEAFNDMASRLKNREILLEARTNALAIEVEERRRAEQEILRRNRQLAAAAEIARAATSTLDLDALLSTSVKLIRERFGFYHVSLLLIEAGSNTAVLRASSGEVGHTLKVGEHRLAIGSKSLIGSATATHQPVIVQDVLDSPTHLKNPLLPDTRAEAVIPLLSGGTVIGALDMQSTIVGAFGDSDVTILTTIADQLAIAVQNARLYASAQNELVERRHAEQALQFAKEELEIRVEERTTELSQSETRFRTLVEQVPAVTYIASLDEAGETLYVSPQIKAVLGFTPEEWMADPGLWRQQLHPDDRERVLAADEYSHATGEPFAAEYRIFARDGRVVWFHDESRWVRDETGKPRFTQGIEIDITERKRAEEALREAEAKYRALVERIPAAVYVWELGENGPCHYISPQVVPMLGFPVADWLADPGLFFRQVHPDDRARAIAAEERSRATGEPLHSEFRMLRRDGRVVWIRDESVTLPAAEGQSHLNQGFLFDISDRKQVEAALQESEERYTLAVRGANDGLWDWNLKTNEVYFSPRWKSMLGYEENEIGHSPDDWFKHVHPDDLTRVKADLASHLEGGTSHFESEYRMRHADGSYRWILTRGLAVRDATDHAATRMAGSQTDITSRKLAEERLAHDALHDGLTGLPNRTLFLDRLEHALKRMKRPGDKEHLFAVLFLDIDRFKLVNDSLGHAFGDQLLIKIAERLQKCLRPADTVARLGGDEFVILMEEVLKATDATRIAERVQRELSTPFRLDGHQISTTASIGIAMSETGYDRAEDLLRDADTAMYRAKTLGKARHEIFDAGMHAAVSSLLQMEADLRQAIEKQEFQVYYQPLVSLANGRIVGTEALLRWQHPKRGLLPPAAFITVLEETGMIVPVGEWILRTACAQNKAWQDKGHPHLRVAVNFSARQFQIKNLAQLVKNVLNETGMDPKTLELEITESTAMKDTKLTIKTLNELHALGVGISLDDFGSSYSALGYLKRFPFQKLKADRSFIMDIPNDANDTAITAAIIAMAHSLKLRVVAEGVETAQQLAFLRSQHCDEVQGFLFSHPLPAGELFTLLRKKRLLFKPKTKTTASPKG